MVGANDYPMYHEGSMSFYVQRLLQDVRSLGERIDAQEKRIVNLEQQVANQALAMKALAQIQDSKTLAAQPPVQNQNPLYAPLRSDTKPLLEMSAFVRKVSSTCVGVPNERAWYVLRELITEAREILKRST